MSMMGAAAATGGGRAGQFVITVDTSQVDRLLSSLEGSITGASLLTFLRNEASDFFRRDIESRFEEEGDVKSGFWEPLKDVTIDIRRAMGYADGPINRRSGDLQNYLEDSRDFNFGPGYASMEVPGTAPNALVAKKFDTAQFGSNDNPIPGFGPTPPRPVLPGPSEMDLGVLLGLLEIHIMKTMAMGLGGTLGVIP